MECLSWGGGGEHNIIDNREDTNKLKPCKFKLSGFSSSGKFC